MIEDPVVKRVRETRHRISEQFNHDVERYCVFLKSEERRHKGRIIRQPVKLRKAV